MWKADEKFVSSSYWTNNNKKKLCVTHKLFLKDIKSIIEEVRFNKTTWEGNRKGKMQKSKNNRL